MSDKKGNNDGGFMKFLYNSDTGEVLGRTGMSWLKIIVFYIIFYAGLAAFFGLMLYIFYQTLDINKPKYQLGDSLIGSNPGVGFRPQPDQDKNVDSTLIWFKRGDRDDFKFWSEQLKSYVEEARKTAGKNCDFGADKASDKEACQVIVDEKKFGNCTVATDFGYKDGSPCVLIKLNRIYGWKPEPFGPARFSEAEFKKAIDDKANSDAKFPKILKTAIEKKLQEVNTEAAKEDVAKSVWINCDGENPADRENMGKISYAPMQAIQSFYFPFMKQPNYVSPFIMVQFESVTRGVLINIECKAYAKNIFPDRASRTGSVHFELMVE
ncbi:sodium/potassium-transporting ATPase subunit beta [Folsomia candida]|uniref:Sodium/potassium-transporting ATPase subunit beta n=1 Tax=Folsomia candida TaxID=158441 RepID=A0A226DN85_FOLCA|nr:sodium/potassium-transporting ATPase subunit beta [Folsomia candida]XP_021960440.1 sodium/potassium-transporting ATPase subunit beta [Folsomia candida]XP_021960441.1 sodium/potassium-transporting ATPase subunit beta [Folsomia candida]OXA46560.1 Sodium/potassium-transporting ATPase subunit beta [Folsomia candida]